MNAKNPEQRSSAVLNYDSAPTNATYEELLNQGWEHVFSFNLHQPGHWPMAQQEIDQFKNAGYLVTMVPSKDMAERNGG